MMRWLQAVINTREIENNILIIWQRNTGTNDFFIDDKAHSKMRKRFIIELIRSYYLEIRLHYELVVLSEIDDYIRHALT